MYLRHLDLFSGIGGFSLAAKVLGGIKTTQFVEIDPYCQKVLAKNFPGVPIHDDIRTFTASQDYELVTSAFPCQPHSLSGLRKASEDSRDLWGETYRIICEARPKYVLLENVRGLISSESGYFFKRILWQLAEVGYDAEWDVISCQDVEGCHKRERIWIIATNTQSSGWSTPWNSDDPTRSDEAPISRCDSPEIIGGTDTSEVIPRVCRDDDGLSSELDLPYLMKPEDVQSWLSIATDAEQKSDRRPRLTALGNAIVPQVAIIPLKRILKDAMTKT